MKDLFSKLVIALLVVCATSITYAQKEKDKIGVEKFATPIRRDVSRKGAKTQRKEIAKNAPNISKATKSKNSKDEKQNEKSIATSPNVAVVYCGGTGRVTVRGWDKSEVRAESEKGSKVNLIAVKEKDKSSTISQVKVTVVDEDLEDSFLGPCFSNSNLDIYVPRGASLDLKTQEGDMNVEQVAKARLKSLSGSFSLRAISAYVQAETTSGDILIDNSSGQITLKAVSGSIDVRNVKPSESADYLFASSISGDVTLDRVFYWRVEGSTVTGDVNLYGALTKDATYNFRTTTGSVTIAIPANSSFRVNATVSRNGEIISDFPISKPSETTSTRTTTRLIGTYGKGDSTLNLTAFNGIVHIRKK